MKRVIAAELVHQTEPEETGLAVHTRPRRSGWRRVATAAVAIAGLVALLSPPAVVPASPAAAMAIPVLAWQPCTGSNQRGFDCAIA